MPRRHIKIEEFNTAKSAMPGRHCVTRFSQKTEELCEAEWVKMNGYYFFIILQIFLRVYRQRLFQNESGSHNSVDCSRGIVGNC